MDDKLFPSVRQRLQNTFNQLRQSQTGQAVGRVVGDAYKTGANLLAMGMQAGQFGTQALADRRTKELEEANRLAKQAIGASPAQKQFLLGKSRDISFKPTVSGKANELLSRGVLATRKAGNTEMTGPQAVANFAIPAANTALWGTGAGMISKMAMPQKLITGALSAGIPGAVGYATGQNPIDSATAGLINAPRYIGISKVTQPLVTATSANLAKNMGTIGQQVIGRTTGGTLNVLEDELLSKLSGVDNTMADRALSFGLGALLTDTKAINKYIQDLKPEQQVQAKKIIDEVKDKAGKVKVGTEKVDPIIRTMQLDKDGNRLEMKLSEYIKKVRSGEIQDVSIDQNLKKNTKESAMGMVAGFEPEFDEDGKLIGMGYSPEKGLLGVAGMVAGKKIKGVKTPIDTPPIGAKVRGLVESVQGAENIAQQTKAKVMGDYIPKPNKELMGEAKGLLEENVQVDFKGVKNTDQKVAATIQEAINAQSAGDHQKAANLFNNLAEIGTDLGRGVQAFSLLKKMSPEAISLSLAGKIKKYNLTAKTPIPELTPEQTKLIQSQVQALDLLKGRERNIALNQLKQTLDSFIPSSFADKALAVWKAGLLTSFRTQERNFLGNFIHGLAEVAKDVPATLADKILSYKTGKRTVTLTLQGIPEAWSKRTGQQMSDLFGMGFDPEEALNKFDYKTITWGNSLLERGLKKYTDIVFRSLGAADKPFYNAAMARSLYDQAGAMAINAGKQGNIEYIEKLVKSPTKKMIKNAIEDASTATFKTVTLAGNFIGRVKKELSKNEYSKVFSEVTFPFTGVPSSVFTQIVDYSPVGLLKGINSTTRVALGQMPKMQRKAVQELGRGVIGTGIYTLGAYLYDKGIITGQPKDQAEQRQWELENKPRNSIFIAGKWRSLNSIGPEAVVFMAGAKLREEMSKEDGSAGSYLSTVGKDFLDQSFVQGISAPVNAITDPQRYGKAYLGQLASSPVPNIIKDLSKATDPVARETNTVFDYAKQGIPGLRQTLTERRDVLGNVIPQEPSGAYAFVDLFNSKTPRSSEVINELSRLNKAGYSATPGKIGKKQTIGGVEKELTPEELNQFEDRVGRLIQSQVKDLISTPQYQALSDEDKQSAIQKVMTDSRKRVRVSGMQTNVPQMTKGVYTVINPETGSTSILDVAKVATLPSTTNFDKAVKRKEVYSMVAKIVDSSLSEADKDNAYRELGVTPREAKYYRVAKEDNELKTAYIMDEISKLEPTNRQGLLQLLVQGRQEVNGKMIATSGVIDSIYDMGLITNEEKTKLKKIEISGTLVKPIVKITGRGKTAKLKSITFKPVKLKVSRTRLKTVKLNPIKLKSI